MTLCEFDGIRLLSHDRDLRSRYVSHDKYAMKYIHLIKQYDRIIIKDGPLMRVCTYINYPSMISACDVNSPQLELYSR